ncbi:MAG: SUMF1/EgtB/PvdO family nonheme iron enzyme [Deltaproteobacteria bacterium]|nr:SUMF1/EgtB/PvdO family nonheme iron enzyme [Deltaproteobacteria bacterium]
MWSLVRARGRTEVTVAAYARCVAKGACTEPDAYDEKARQWCNWKRAGRDDDPINCVDHAQAAAYCAFVGGRLPSEAEWEWSARGYEQATTYPWGSDEPAGRACWDGPGNQVSDEREGTCPVGSFKDGANPKGVLDLAGNVWEWTSTESGGKAIDKGGGYPNAVSSRLAAKDRNAVDKAQRSSTLGFRCVRTPSPPVLAGRLAALCFRA